MKSICIAALARDELDEAADWYDERSSDLGRQLIESIDNLTESIAENPRQYPIVHRDIRRALTRRFPYGGCRVPSHQGASITYLATLTPPAYTGAAPAKG